VCDKISLVRLPVVSPHLEHAWSSEPQSSSVAASPFEVAFPFFVTIFLKSTVRSGTPHAPKLNNTVTSMHSSPSDLLALALFNFLCWFPVASAPTELFSLASSRCNGALGIGLQLKRAQDWV